MKFKITRQLLFSLGFAVLFTFLLIVTMGYGYRSRLIPMVVLVPGLIAALFQVVVDVREALGGNKPAKSEATAGQTDAANIEEQEKPMEGVQKEKLTPGEKRRRELIAVGWLALSIVLIFLFGMSAAILIFVIAYMRFYGHESWRLSIGIAVAICAFVYIAFVWGLRNDLYPGFILEQLQR